jgi:uncharacterized membrane protein
MGDRGLKIALVASLVLNVFVIGAAAGAVFIQFYAPAAKPAGSPNPLMVAAEKLNPADHDAFRQMMQDQNLMTGPTRLDARQARAEAIRLMQTQPFDRAAAGAALDRTRADDIKVRGVVENAVLDFAAKLGPQARATLSLGFVRGAGGRQGLASSAAPAKTAAPN